MEANMNLLFPDFLSSAEAYAEAQGYWSATLSALVAERGHTLLFPFYTQSLRDGTPLRDGNPIFSGYVPEQHKLLRIIQYVPAPGDEVFSTWQDSWPAADMPPGFRPPSDGGAEGDVPELVVSLALSEETGAAARAAIGDWLDF